ncbi:MAG: Ig-like domain-containing protein [Acetivibrio sp.]
MRKMKRFATMVMLSLTLCMTVETVAPAGMTVVAEAAAKVKLSAAKKSIDVGEKITLKVVGTSKKALWTTNKKSVATVSQKGKVTGKKEGMATITAKVDGKKYTCKVTVKAKENEFVVNSPYETVETKIGDNSIVVPKDWTEEKSSINGIEIKLFFPKDADNEKGSSNVTVTSVATGAQNENFDLYKEAVSQQITAEYLKNQLVASGMKDATITELAITSEKRTIGEVLVISYNIEIDGKKAMSQKIYDIFAGNYTTEVTVTDNMSATTPDVYEVGNYIVESLTLKK